MSKSINSMSVMHFMSGEGTPESVVVEPKNGVLPLTTHSGNPAKALHAKLLNVIKSKNHTLRKCKSLFFRVPFAVSVLSKINHDSTLSSFEIISATGDSLVVSSTNQKLLLQAKCGIVESMKVMRHSLPIKTPAQMVKEAGW